MDSIREYVDKSGANIANDKRKSSDFVDVFLKQDSVDWGYELEICSNCGKKRMDHSRLSKLCPNRFSFFETK